MICTEDEAKTKWCPFARCAGEINGATISGANRLGEPWQSSPFVQQTMCIGSDCMAWRWSDAIWTDAGGNWNCDTDPPSRTRVDRGFCGLAGRSE